MLGVEHPYLAYCLDNAVWMFGSALELELKKIEGKTQRELERKQDRKLRQWLDLPLRYRNPVGAMPGRKRDIEHSVKGELT
jgi:hypothetical protein